MLRALASDSSCQLLFFLTQVLLQPRLASIYYVAQPGLEHLVLLCLSTRRWDYRLVLPWEGQVEWKVGFSGYWKSPQRAETQLSIGNLASVPRDQ